MTRLKVMRESMGIRGAELARRLNVTRATVWIAEQKGVRSVSAARRYAAVLNCDWRDVLDDEREVKRDGD